MARCRILLLTEAQQRFQSLECLMLDDNRLSDPKAFASLATLRKLEGSQPGEERVPGPSLPASDGSGVADLQTTTDSPRPRDITCGVPASRNRRAGIRSPELPDIAASAGWLREHIRRSSDALRACRRVKVAVVGSASSAPLRAPRRSSAQVPRCIIQLDGMPVDRPGSGTSQFGIAVGWHTAHFGPRGEIGIRFASIHKPQLEGDNKLRTPGTPAGAQRHDPVYCAVLGAIIVSLIVWIVFKYFRSRTYSRKTQQHLPASNALIPPQSRSSIARFGGSEALAASVSSQHPAVEEEISDSRFQRLGEYPEQQP
uniref:TNFR_16_TM domain-containing protein n=1 Tax=Macrostomum lignano TaxID=282301 RepID=A0A1I8JPC9_9PLAT